MPAWLSSEHSIAGCGGASVEALQGVGGERPGALDLLSLIGWTTYTYAQEKLTLQNVERSTQGISHPERLIPKAGNRLRRRLFLPAGGGFHLRVELLGPVLSWSGTLAVSCKRKTHCHAD